ncbi:ABC transporter permease [Phytohabitans houttuyneae]|uniref:FtsX-like permease family protein n=1 Tax=Phytohabitans houttuyneae TaxID=1076126 RepID=UPI0031F0A337
MNLRLAVRMALLGVRMARAGGRESLARLALMTVGVAIGVPLALLALAAVPILQGHVDRLGWHRTTAASPPTAPDHALWLAVTDRYAGQDVIRVHVAALGDRPPVPPGISRLPGPGEKVVSPALARLLLSVPDGELDDRYPGAVVGEIGPDGLLMPDELVAVVGHTPDQLRAMRGATEIRGIEQPDARADLVGIWGVFFGMIAVLVVGPIAIFVAMTARIGGPRREVRFAAARLAGATRLQTAVFAATETALAAVAGAALGWLAFALLKPVVASRVTLGHGMPIFVDDVRVPLVPLLVILLGVPLVAVGATLVAMHPVQLAPLGVRHRQRRPAPGLWRIAPILAGFGGIWYSTVLSRDDVSEASTVEQATVQMVSTFSVLSVLVGFFLAGAWVCMWVSRGMARLSRSVTSLMVARRIAADPYGTFRMVGGAAIAVYVATTLGFVAAANQEPGRSDNQTLLAGGRPVLDPGVVAVHVQGATQDEVAPLMSAGVVVARRSPEGEVVVRCTELARVTTLDCPLPVYREGVAAGQDYLRVEDLFTVPAPGASSADLTFQPSALAEPAPGADLLPIQTLLIPTDGTVAAQERVRTLAARTLPLSRSKTSDDLAVGPILDVTAFSSAVPYAMVIILIFTACSLTVSVITGVLERRRAFAALRASGVSLGQLRRVVLLETGAPLAITVLFGVGLATVQSLATFTPDEWTLPGGEFVAGLGAGVLAAFAVSLIALPFMNAATRLDTVRYE